MSYLADLLGKSDASFNYVLHSNEKSSGNRGIDVQLIGELHEKAAELLKELGLDVYDTTGVELYHALNNKATRDDSDKFWDKYRFLAIMHDGAPVSANIDDIRENVRLPYGKRQYGRFRQSLLNELKYRYDKHRKVW